MRGLAVLGAMLMIVTACGADEAASTNATEPGAADDPSASTTSVPTTLSIPKITVVPGGGTNDDLQAAADVAQSEAATLLGLAVDEVRADETERIAVPPSSPCAPTHLDVADPDEGRVPAVEVIVTADGTSHRMVVIGETVHDCGVVAP